MRAMRKACLVAVPLLSTLANAGCGGGGASAAGAAAPTPSAAAAPETPGQKCLAIADAPRERRPNEPDKIGVRHILVKYAGAKKADGVTRTREQACLRAMEARDALRGGADFEKIVAEYSEEPGAASRGGSLGTIERKDVVPPFADVAFQLDMNQLSDIVETDFGFHVILRTE
jgi:parvulin-like peptidyl-prolyl isomerase